MKRTRQRFDRPGQDMPVHVSGVRQFEGEDLCKYKVNSNDYYLVYHQRMAVNAETQKAWCD